MTWCWERLRAGGEGGDRGWDCWMSSPTQWTWVWANSRRQWRTGKPSVQFSRSVLSDSLRPHESQHPRPLCPSPTPGIYSNSSPSSQWCHQVLSSSVIPFSSCPQSLPESGSFPMSQLFASGGQSVGVSTSTSVLPMNSQDWSPLGLTDWISLQSKGLSRVFSNTTVGSLECCKSRGCKELNTTKWLTNNNIPLYVAQKVKHLPTMQETQVQSLGWEDVLEKDMATHSSILAGKSHGRRSLVGYSPWGRKESDTTERLHFHLHHVYHLTWQ